MSSDVWFLVSGVHMECTRIPDPGTKAQVTAILTGPCCLVPDGSSA